MGLALDAYVTGGYVHRALPQEYRRIGEVAERTVREREEVERMKADLSNRVPPKSPSCRVSWDSGSVSTEP
jgi:hypothetical protein